jgi:hypothetical protein
VERRFIQLQRKCGHVLRELLKRRATDHGKRMERVAQHVRERNLRDGDVMLARERPCALQPLDILFGAEVGRTPPAHAVAVWILRIVVI